MADISGYLNNIKSAESGETVRDSIIQCLNKINNDNPNKTKPLNVTANGTYTSETGYSYNPVTVNVPAGGASGYTFEELEVTENGEYEPDEDNKMFNKVTVNVPQLAKDLAPDGYTITQNGEYDPLLDGYDGYGKIIVNVNEATGEGPFTVQFYDRTKTTVIHTETVPKGGKATCTIYDGTTYNGQYFTGWNPSPTNVTRDMKCYPQFGDVVIDPNEIQDSWETICAKAGAGYALGAYKALVVNVPARPGRDAFKFDTVNAGTFYSSNGVTNDAFPIAMHMVKVAEGEDGTTSTWLSTGVLPIFPIWDNGRGGYCGESNIEIRSALIHWPHPSPTEGTISPDILLDWVNSPIREYLNEYLIENLPECVGQTIKAVHKMTASLNLVPYSNPFPSNPVKIDVPSIDKIWIPSYKELYSFMETKTGVGDFRAASESSGVDYTAVYMPTYPVGTRLTRSIYAQNSFRMGHVNISQNNINDLSMYGGFKGFSPGSPIGFCL